MSRRESKVESYIDTMSSGDSNNMKPKQKSKEVNNNEVDELSKEFSEMGCIVDAMKRPPNICVETCVYESDSEESQTKEGAEEEDAYSDEFEEDKSEEEASVKVVNEKSDDARVPEQSSVTISKSQSSMCSKPPLSISGRSGRSTAFGDGLQGDQSILNAPPVPAKQNIKHLCPNSIIIIKLTSVSMHHTRRINMSFSNERLREIERHNHILLSKIMSARNSKKSSIPQREQPPRKPVPAAAMARKTQQRQIDHDNMILLKKIQRAKSSALSIRR